MKKILFALLIALGGAVPCIAQTNTPTNTNTPSSTPTRTPTFTPSSTLTPTPTFTPSPQPLQGAPITLTVKNGFPDSASIALNEGLTHRCTVIVPATIDGTATLKIAPTRANFTGGGTLQLGAGTDVLLAVGKAVPLPELNAAQLWVHLSTNATADRAFIVTCTAFGR